MVTLFGSCYASMFPYTNAYCDVDPLNRSYYVYSLADEAEMTGAHSSYLGLSHDSVGMPALARTMLWPVCWFLFICCLIGVLESLAPFFVFRIWKVCPDQMIELVLEVGLLAIVLHCILACNFPSWNEVWMMI